MLDVLIKGGTVVSPFDIFNADIGVKDGKIATVSKTSDENADRIVSANGKLVFAGAIDAHTHLNDRYEFFGTRNPDDFESSSVAAACGGVTTFLEFARQIKGQSLVDCLDMWRRDADPKVIVDYGIHMIITDVNREVIEEIPRLIQAGVPTFKLYMAYKNVLMVDDGSILDVMGAVARSGGLVGLHCENNDLVEHARRGFKPGRGKYVDYFPPIIAEAEAVQRASLYACSTNCKMYVVHLSTRLGREVAREGMTAGKSVFGETCPHYLAFTDEVYSREDWPLFTVSPPIRGIDDQEALWAGLADGDIKIVASDNAGRNRVDKMNAKDDITKMPVGISGIEVILPILYTLGVKKGRISVNKMVEVTSYNPAVLFGLFPRKGIISVGSDADIVVFDPRKEVRLSRDAMHSKIDHSVFDHITAEGYPVVTISKGTIVWEDEQFEGKAGSGKYVPRSYSENLARKSSGAEKIKISEVSGGPVHDSCMRPRREA